MLIATVVVGAILVVVSLIAAAVLLARAVLPRAWRRRIVPQAESWPHETLEATVVETPGSSRTRHLFERTATREPAPNDPARKGVDMVAPGDASSSMPRVRASPVNAARP